VAHFYNTIDQQMIPSQRPMMLGLALAFEQVIKVQPTFASKYNKNNNITGYSVISADSPISMCYEVLQIIPWRF